MFRPRCGWRRSSPGVRCVSASPPITVPDAMYVSPVLRRPRSGRVVAGLAHASPLPVRRLARPPRSAPGQFGRAGPGTDRRAPTARRAQRVARLPMPSTPANSSVTANGPGSSSPPATSGFLPSRRARSSASISPLPIPHACPPRLRSSGMRWILCCDNDLGNCYRK